MTSNDISEINSISERLSSRVDRSALENLRNRAVSSGMSLETFRENALALLPSLTPVTDYRSLDWNKKELSRYSLSRAILSQADKNVDGGFEREISREMELRHGKRPEGIFVPDEIMARNQVAGTGTLGGHLIQTENLGGEFINILRNKSQVINMGARVINLSRQSTIPRQSASATSAWLSETAASTLSGVQLQQITLTPQAVGANVQFSKMCLMESSPGIDALLKDDITEILATAIDLAALAGTGSGMPQGIYGTTGVGSVVLSANGLAINNTTAFPLMVSLESVVAAANADEGSLGYLMRSSVRGQLKTQVAFANTDKCVFETITTANGTNEGRVNGYRALTSQQISNALSCGTATTLTTPIYFGNWADCLISQFGSTDLVIDPYSQGSRGIIAIYARKWVDVGIRRPASFCIGHGILNG